MRLTIKSSTGLFSSFYDIDYTWTAMLACRYIEPFFVGTQLNTTRSSTATSIVFNVKHMSCLECYIHSR